MSPTRTRSLALALGAVAVTASGEQAWEFEAVLAGLATKGIRWHLAVDY